MKSKKFIILSIIILAIIFISIYLLYANNNVIFLNKNVIKSGAISYSIDGISVSVSSTTSSFTNNDLKSLIEMACTKHEDGYFNKLINTQKIVYLFKFLGPSQDDDTFKVTLLQNKLGYKSIEQFKNDLDQCGAGGDTYPKKLNSDWLLFVNGCGTGYDDDSGRPHGCDEVRKVIESNLKLN